VGVLGEGTPMEGRQMNRLRNWMHDSIVVPCGFYSWPRWARVFYWTYYLTWNDFDGPISPRTAYEVAKIIA